MKKTIPAKAGFTLLEVFLATIIMVIAFSGVATGVALSRKNLTTARLQRMAVEIADNRLEYYKAFPPEKEESSTETVLLGAHRLFVDYDIELQQDSRPRKNTDLDYEYYLVRVSVDHENFPHPVSLSTIIEKPQ